MFAQLGDIQFEGVKTPRSWTESRGAVFGEIPHVGRKPSLQFTGEMLVTMDLSIRLSQEFCDVTEELAKLYQAMAGGRVLPLITGVGVMVGRFVITAIDNRLEQMASLGELISVSLDVQLKEYVQPPGAPSPPEGEAITGFRNREGITRQPQEPRRANTTEAQSISNDLSKARSAVNAIKGVLSSIQRGAKTMQQGVRQARYMSNTAKLFYQEAQRKIAYANKIKRRAERLPTSLDEAIDYADNLSKIGNLANESTLERHANQLIGASDNVNRDATTVGAFVATREGGS